MHDLGPQPLTKPRSPDCVRRAGRAARLQPAAGRFAGVALFAAAHVLAASALLPRAANAQLRAGAYGVYQTGVYEGSWGVGGRAEASLDFLMRGLTVAATYDHLFPACADCSAFDLGAQVLVTPPAPVYLGLGGTYARLSSGGEGGTTNADWAFSLIAGIRLPVLPVVLPFVEVRQQLLSSSINQLTVAAGVVFAPASSRNAPARRTSR